MSLADRLRAQMRWRGIKSQNQLSRLSGVPQSSIHRLLVRGDSYDASWRTLERLAQALNTTASWLGAGHVPHAPASSPGVNRPALGYAAELSALMTRLPESACRQILSLVRMLAEGAGKPPAPGKNAEPRAIPQTDAGPPSQHA
ncbi:MAG: helix-turn-helix domain-containing protein [Burkholderiaceae bacterium]|jgi:hypothetical protein|nr:helix-turn-helix domain-containing protein [Burkholderiaceae bacterium]